MQMAMETSEFFGHDSAWGSTAIARDVMQFVHYSTSYVVCVITRHSTLRQSGFYWHFLTKSVVTRKY